MAKGLFAVKKILKDKKRYLKKKLTRYSKKAEKSNMVSALVLSKVQIEARQPNSAARKCIKVQLIKNKKFALAFVPGDLAIKLINENDEVHLVGIGGARGGPKGDIPKASFKVVKLNNISLIELVKGKKTKTTY